MSRFFLKWMVFCAVLLVSQASSAATVMLHGVRAEVYFSPKGGAEEAIVRTISQAQREVCVLAYSYSSATLNAALVEAHARGVHVRVVLDKSKLAAKGSKLQRLLEAGIPVRIDSTHALAHNKVMIIDKRRVITGSFNFTKSAEEQNAENVLIIHSRSLSKKYLLDFEQHVQHGERALPQ